MKQQFYFIFSLQDTAPLPNETRIPGQVKHGSSTLKKSSRSHSYGAADLSSFSSVDLSSMIASWVDRNSCSEYETELKVSAGTNFKAKAMKRRASTSYLNEDDAQSLPNSTTIQHSFFSEPSARSISSDMNSWANSSKKLCSLGASNSQDFLRYATRCTKLT